VYTVVVRGDSRIVTSDISLPSDAHYGIRSTTLRSSAGPFISTSALTDDFCDVLTAALRWYDNAVNADPAAFSVNERGQRTVPAATMTFRRFDTAFFY